MKTIILLVFVFALGAVFGIMLTALIVGGSRYGKEEERGCEDDKRRFDENH